MVGNKEKAPKTYVTDLLTGILNRNVLKDVTHVENVKLADDGRSIVILDQSALPNRTEYLTLQALPEFYDAIFTLKVRGAPCIGIFAGYAMSVLARQIAGELELSGTVSSEKWRSFINRLSELGEELNSSRPTAVNLSYAIKRMLAKAESLVAETNCSAEGLLDELQREATAIHEEDIEMCRKIAEAGLTLIKDGDGILTHCNAGPLATSRYGTALGPILLGKERGLEFHVFADETRPLLQGARLTSYELSKAGVDVTLICDNMASIVMKSGKVQACFVGCDRVAANGDAANKIGTSGVAILAKHYGIPFYVLGPSSTIDMATATGADIVIEERDPDEIKNKFYAEPMALPEVKCYNPAFDVTDHELITAIVTEKGVIRPPYKEAFTRLFK